MLRLIADLLVGEPSAAEKEMLVAVDRFIQERVVPEVAQLDLEDRYPFALVEEMRSLGLFGLPILRRFGGLEARPSVIACSVALLSSGWLSLAALLGSHWRVAAYLSEFGTPEQKERLLPRLASGEVVAAHALSEPGGKDPTRFVTTLLRRGGGGKIAGQKSYVTNGANADLIAVACRRQSRRLRGEKRVAADEGLAMVLLERERPGLYVGDNLERLGVKGVSLCPIVLQDIAVDISHDCIGGSVLDARLMLEASRIPGNINFAARAVGVGESIMDASLDYLGTDRGGMRLCDVQAVRVRFGWLATQQLASRLMLGRFLQALEAGRAEPEGAEMCKVFTSRSVVEIAHSALLLCGGAGFTDRLPIGRNLRDALSLEICGRPNDSLLETIGSALLG